MGITGDRYTGTFLTHTIELVRNNWDKTLRLLIDGREVARASRALPHDIILTAELQHAGMVHTVVARSVVRFPSTVDTIDVDGDPLPLTKGK